MRGFTLTLTLAVVLALASPAAAANDPFGDFISPVSNPVNFEDPRATTEIRPLWAYHDVSDSFAGVVGGGGGHAHVLALQARVALTERLAIIATKDGYVWLRPNPEVAGVLEDNDGWANIGFGLKYALYYHPERRAIGTFGLRYEAASGNRDVFQGRGKGVLNPFFSTAFGVDQFHFMGYVGSRVPISGDDSTFFDMSLHGDYKVGSFFPLVEFNWVQTLYGGRRLPLDQEGFDFFNLGSTKAGGNGVVTMAVGARWRAIEGVEFVGGRHLGVDLGTAFELPMTGRQDIFGWRVTTDVIVFLR